MSICIPKSLQAMPNWCVWKLELNAKGNLTKVPYDIQTAHKASSTDRSTWNPLQMVIDLLQTGRKGYTGLGFMISDGIVFIDVDHCIENDGCIDDRGKDILKSFPESYAEISQSGKGIHILTKGTIPRCFNNRKLGVEMYNGDRYCAYTGNAIQRNDPTEEQCGIDYVFNKYSTRASSGHSKPPQVNNYGICHHSDAWIINHATNITSQRGRDFRSLFDGDIGSYESASEADSALCVLLAFWTDRNLGQMDRIFRKSKLYRAKWEREDYRNRTMIHACDHIPESLSEYQQRMYREKAKAIAEER